MQQIPDTAGDPTALRAINISTAQIEHRHGINHYVGFSDDDVRDQIAAYCRDYWSDWNKDPAPSDRDELIERYFQHTLNEEGCAFSRERAALSLNQFLALSTPVETPDTEKTPHATPGM
ncbi:hypothetical protein GCM10019059_39150 [Camelimonas fluminis]|uniref:Uncharacterized protein n=1 Tax=Camelimonas fluminis TaxID=1576911 RepID=A0ABV7UHZ5_9HYPH|nr:hypothetical protein [Camelimonas fluminis]GHE75970.1 hypothetical protein GCM10019059_39150 [Camelimonas fluminis]